MSDRVDDKAKQHARMLDATKPVPVPAGEGKDASTDEGQEPTFLYERAPQAPEPPREGSALHPKVAATAASFDDEIEASRAPGRPARSFLAPRGEAASTRQPAPPPIEPGTSDVFTSHKPTVAPRAPGATGPLDAHGRRPDDVETRAMVPAALPVSANDRAEPDEPTRARDPEPPTPPSLRDAPPTATHVRPPRAGAAMDDVTLRLPEAQAPALPDAPTLPAVGPVPGAVGDEAEHEAPVDVTPALPRPALANLPDRLAPDERARLANDDTRVKTPPRTGEVDARRGGRAPVIGAALLALAIVAGLIVGMIYRGTMHDDDEVVSTVVDVKALPPVPPPTPTPPTPPTAPTPTPTPTPPTPTPTPPTPTPTPPTPTPTPPTPPPLTTETAPVDENPPPAPSSRASDARPPARPRDGFGPFVDKSGSGVVGLGPALGRGVRAALGAKAFAGSLLGVRGEVKRLEVSRADSKVSATAECTLVVTERSVARATLGTTARVVDQEKVGRDRVARLAAESCALALESTLKAAVAHATR